MEAQVFSGTFSCRNWSRDYFSRFDKFTASADLGTGKDLDEYVHEGTLVLLSFIDIADAGFRFNLFMYQQEFLKVWQD